jgi:SAM-dependent methyltransferase
MAQGTIARGTYTYKGSPHSRHSLLLDALQAEGHGQRVLDVGCAGGYLAQILAARGYEVVGIERPGGCGDDFPDNVELVEADLDAGLPRLSGKFEFAICGDVLEHLKDPARILAQIASVLTQDGLLVASVPNSGNLYFRLNILAGRFPRQDKGLFDRTHLHYYMWEGWKELFESAGFQIEERKVSGVPLSLALTGWKQAPVRALEKLAYAAARLRPTLFAYQFVLTARRLP